MLGFLLKGALKDVREVRAKNIKTEKVMEKREKLICIFLKICNYIKWFLKSKPGQINYFLKL